jgi:hypothetical protein
MSDVRYDNQFYPHLPRQVQGSLRGEQSEHPSFLDSGSK